MNGQATSEPGNLQVERGNPQGAAVEFGLDLLRVQILFDEVPRRLEPGRVEDFVMEAGAPCPVVDTHEAGRGECRAQGTRHAESRGGAGTRVEAGYEHRFSHRCRPLREGSFVAISRRRAAPQAGVQSSSIGRRDPRGADDTARREPIFESLYGRCLVERRRIAAGRSVKKADRTVAGVDGKRSCREGSEGEEGDGAEAYREDAERRLHPGAIHESADG